MQRREPLSSIPIDRRRKVETQGGTARRQAPSTVNRQDVTANSDVGSVEECSKVEFTKDEVLALLNERAKAGKFDTKVGFVKDRGVYSFAVFSLKITFLWGYL